MLTKNEYLQGLLVVMAICSVILLLKVKFANFYGANQDDKPVEDAMLPKMPVPTDIKRRQRAIMNDMENIPVDLAVFWGAFIAVFVASIGGSGSEEALGLIVLLPCYTFFRILHTAFYLAALQPYRTVAFVLAMTSVFSGAGILISAAAKAYSL